MPSWTVFINIEHVPGPSSSGALPRRGGGGGREAREVSRYISQEGRKPWSIKGCTQGWLSLGIRLLQHRLTQSLERTPPGISWYTGICFVREEKERYAQGERGNFKAWSLRPWQRTHCCRHKCFPVCPRTQHLLRTQKVFLILFRNILCPQQMFPSLRSPRNIAGNNVSATMRPRLPGPLGSDALYKVFHTVS